MPSDPRAFLSEAVCARGGLSPSADSPITGRVGLEYTLTHMMIRVYRSIRIDRLVPNQLVLDRLQLSALAVIN